MAEIAPRVTPFLWFNDNADEAVTHYERLFPNTRRINESRYPDELPEGVPGTPGSLMVVEFELDGQRVHAINGGPHYVLTPAFSFVVRCEDQAEVDHYWEGLLTGGGTTMQCGWLTDAFGVSWQIVPRQLGELMSSPDRDGASRTMQAMMQMVKLDIAGLEAAFRGE
jgi:predicted 3-demethylubiquinone-9 3-methyltransferase (glyoxalase superfamily)